MGEARLGNRLEKCANACVCSRIGPSQRRFVSWAPLAQSGQHNPLYYTPRKTFALVNSIFELARINGKERF